MSSIKNKIVQERTFRNYTLRDSNNPLNIYSYAIEEINNGYMVYFHVGREVYKRRLRKKTTKEEVKPYISFNGDNYYLQKVVK